MHRGLILLAALGLGACASTTPRVDVDPLFADRQFPDRVAVPTADEIFALSPQAREYLNDAVERRVRGNRSPAYALYDIVHNDLKLDYDTAVSRTAREAFEARAGNCLSLVILTGAMARELELPVAYQSIYGFETWSRAEGLAFLSGHVNLVLDTHPRADGFVVSAFERELVIDFVEDARSTLSHARQIREDTLVAMFLNNRAAELMAGGQLDAAYWFVRAAMKSDPQYWSAYNTLAVIYLRHGDLRGAERALDAALLREPANPQMLTNLAKVLSRAGRQREAEAVRQRLAAVEPYPPFYFLDRGKAALAAGDADAALALFGKELKRMPYDHELHFNIALAELEQGEMPQAREHLTLALRNSGSRNQRAIYASKLEHLRTLEVH
ncbi:MAG TPA: tetratricopeptide repeat protein [Fontimonas sp.]